MVNNKNTQAFCLTHYMRWLSLIGVLVIILVTGVILGFNDDRTKDNLDKLDQMTMHGDKAEHRGGNHATGGATNNAGGAVELVRLQESYADIAANVRAVTVNISAETGIGSMQNNGVAFANPFGNRDPMGGDPNVIGVAITAPPITPDAPMPHPYQGVCSNCHTIVKKPSPAKVAVPGKGKSSVGSGMIIDPTGYILTNYHIVENANNILVTTSGGTKYRAELKYTDVNWDLAILKINSSVPFPAATLGNSDLTQEGDIVIAVGNPFGLNQTVTAGIISDTQRSVNIGGKNYKGLIQTDAAINRGSSGGPLVNIKGEVIGINTAIYSITGDFTGVGFAVPVNRAKDVFRAIPSLNATAANALDINIGDVITVAMVADQPAAWFGVEVASIDPIMAGQFGRTNTNGVIVNRIFPDSPSEAAGIKRGDILTSIDGRRLTDVNKFQAISSTLLPGQTILLKGLRGDRKFSVTSTLLDRKNVQVAAPPGRNRQAAAGPTELEWMGLEIVPITPQLQQRFGIAKGERGVVVIEAEGLAAASGIMAGDVIKAMNREPITNMADFANVSPGVSVTDGVLFDIARQGDPLYITM